MKYDYEMKCCELEQENEKLRKDSDFDFSEYKRLRDELKKENDDLRKALRHIKDHQEANMGDDIRLYKLSTIWRLATSAIIGSKYSDGKGK